MKRIISLCSALLVCCLFSSRANANLPYYPLEFPRDEGGHFDNTPYQSPMMLEWWYLNGDLESRRGDALAFELAIFALRIPLPDGSYQYQHWSHLHVTNLDEQRQVAGQAVFPPSDVSISTTRLNISYGDSVSLRRMGHLPLLAIKGKMMDLSGSEEIEVDLWAWPEGDPLPIGGSGLISMPDGGNSYYYSQTRATTGGKVRIGENTYWLKPRKSSTWIDHQWGDFFPGAHGWEWFSVRLENGLDANIFVHILRETQEVKGGMASVVMPNGEQRFIELDSTFNLGRSDYWYSPLSGHEYPLRHQLEFPELDLSLDIQASFPDQDVGGYEGHCSVSAEFEGEALDGFAYMELLY